jgi:general secretion pathway protein D
LFLVILVGASLASGCEQTRRTRYLVPDSSSPLVASQAPRPVEAGPLVSQQATSDAEGGSGLAGPEIYPGGSPPLVTSAGEGVADVGNEDITLNFANADVRQVVNEILGNALGLTYVIDPRVQGTITLRSARPLKRDTALGVLEDVLAMNGAALVREGEVYKVLPIAEAVTSPPILRQGATPIPLERGFGLYVFPLRFASASALLETLQPLAPPGSIIRVDPERNLLILAATSSQAEDFGDLLALFDVDWMRDKSFGLFPLANASADNVSAELRKIFGEPGKQAEASVIEFLPIQRLNAILVITPQESYLDTVKTWVRRLDRGIEGDRRRLYVYFVQNGRAKELADVVGKALSAEVSQTAASTAPQQRLPSMVPPEQAPLPGEPPPPLPPGEDEQAGAAIGPGDVYAAPAPLPQGQSPPISAGEAAGPEIGIGGAEPTQGVFRIVADTRNNALLIYATAKEYDLVKAALEKLDIVPLQVLIEATIAEVTLNDTLKYGLEWFFDVGNHTITFNSTNAVTSRPQPNLILSQVPGLSWLFATSDVRVVLNALTAITDVNVISSPTLLVLDNEPARLQVGDQVPIAIRSAQSIVDVDAPIVNEIEYRDTGVILDIIPRVNSNGLVVLDIIQEVSDVGSTSAAAGGTVTEGITPTISQRRIASTVAVNSGETIALGGLIRDTDTQSVTGVPLLSDIPILGNLFKTTADIKRRTELLVLLTPRVVRNSGDARTITEDLRKRLRAVQGLPALIQ